jgi:sigma-B regulation protein RsbU (phosphoserine phosphatase)
MKEKKDKERSDSSQQLDQRLLELTALFEISRSLTSSLSIRSILENILRIPMGHMLIGRGIVLLQHDLDGEFIVDELKGLSRNLIGKSLRIDSPPTRATLVDESDRACKWLDFFREFGIEFLLPLISSRGTIGIVGFGKKIGNKAYTEREIEFLNSLSNIAASAVVNGLIVEESQQINRNLDRKVQQLNTIFDIGRELNTTLDRKKIGSLLSFAVMGELLVNRCIVFTKNEGKMEVLVAKGVNTDIEVIPELNEISEPILVEESERFSKYKDSGISMLVPMRLQDETKGILAIGSKISGVDFDDADEEFLTTLGNQATTSLENARLFEEALEKQRMEEELNLAQSIQQGLLPAELPKMKNYDIAAINVPSHQVGGDYFDVITISEELYGITIADVSGKGAGAALLMANLQASIHALAGSDMPVGKMVSRINNLIYQNTALDKFITFFYAQLDIKNNTFTYCNAGHNPPYIIGSNRKVLELMTGGIILGMMANIEFETETLRLKAGDLIVMFTDGITEAMNEKEEEFGEKRLLSFVKDSPDKSAQDLIEGILSEVDSFSGALPQADDITMVIVKTFLSK